MQIKFTSIANLPNENVLRMIEIDEELSKLSQQNKTSENIVRSIRLKAEKMRLLNG